MKTYNLNIYRKRRCICNIYFDGSERSLLHQIFTGAAKFLILRFCYLRINDVLNERRRSLNLENPNSKIFQLEMQLRECPFLKNLNNIQIRCIVRKFRQKSVLATTTTTTTTTTSAPIGKQISLQYNLFNDFTATAIKGDACDHINTIAHVLFSAFNSVAFIQHISQ